MLDEKERKAILLFDGSEEMKRQVTRLLYLLHYKTYLYKDSIDSLMRYVTSPQKFDLIITRTEMDMAEEDHTIKKIREACPNIRMLSIYKLIEKLIDFLLETDAAREKPIPKGNPTTAIQQALHEK